MHRHLAPLHSQWALPAKNIVIDVAFKMSLSYADIWQLVKIPKKDPRRAHVQQLSTPHSIECQSLILFLKIALKERAKIFSKFY